MRGLACPCCGARIEVDTNGRNSVYCSYCGNQISLFDKRAEHTINENINMNTDVVVRKSVQTRYTDDAEVLKEINKEKSEKRGLIIGLVMFLVSFGILFAMLGVEMIVEKQAKKEGKICAGFYGDLEEKNYKEVVAHFEAAGFTNIELVDLNDSGLAFWKKGQVETISVGGNTSIDSSDYFYPDTKVVITYH